MTTTFHYYDPAPTSAWSVNLGTSAVRLGTFSFTEAADHGDVGSSGFEIDDPTGTAGHSGDAILGLKDILVVESECDVGNRGIFNGIASDRRYFRADSLKTGPARRISIDCLDLNASFGYLVISGSDGNRPAESVGDRLTWLLGSGYMPVHDNGLVVYPSAMMDAVDYRGETCDSVMADCSLQVGYNFFAYNDETAVEISLFFDDSNTSTAYTSDSRLSNVLDDVDSTPTDGDGATHTWGPSVDATLTRTPVNIASGVWLPYATSHVYKTRPATGTLYAFRDRTGADSNVKTLATANLRATRFLRENATESDNIACDVEVDAASVNDIRAGQRLEVKFSHLPGYEDFTWVRVLRRTVSQSHMTPDVYTVHYELSPQEASTSTCGGLALTADGEYYPLGGTGDTPVTTDGTNIAYYWRPGLAADPPTTPTAGWNGRWNFGLMGAGGAGTVDYAGDCVTNELSLLVVGNGTLTIHTATYAGVTGYFGVYIKKFTSAGVFVSGPVTLGLDQPTGVDFVVTITDRASPDCISQIYLTDFDRIGNTCGGKVGYAGATWVGAP